ncbi:ER 25 kDa transmembrane protein [Lodderomyces elongisporus]|uniref:ER 25 kDa transmembrane protein n=1 Tax=Lodderomyces elongisporus TaxID=36914 RepID=UPI00291D766C|nr:ER 25 kDa transmembrane protein [Lodderomyces elongisporus]WLF80261.1 ER 25 kDa transmembrane protein [Lodderomyces elongisporus]
MSLQMSLVFSTMVAQSHSQHFKVVLIFSLVLMSLQFWDCLARLQKYQKIQEQINGNPQYGGGFINYDKLASKFYSERNLYLSGAILYLQLCIGTVVTIVKKLVLKQKILRDHSVELKKKGLAGRDAERKKTDEEITEIVRLKQLIEVKSRDVKVLKKQIKGMQATYDGMNATGIRNKDD